MKMKKKMSNLEDFVLTFGPKPNWRKVAKRYAKEAIAEIKKFRKIYYGETTEDTHNESERGNNG